MKNKNNLIFSSRKMAISFVFEEIIVLFLIIFQFFHFLGIKEVNNSLTLFNNVILPQNILWFIASILTLIIMYFAIALKDARVKQVHKEFQNLF
ncbi:MAG: hypothetical protein WC915_06305 [archaeon]|jgi:hypothetical protein